MNPTYKTIILLIVTILIHFYLPEPFEDVNNDKKKSHINKLYLAIFTSFVVVLTDIILNIEEFTTKIFIIWIFLLLLGIIIFYYVIANQYFVSEEQYLLTMKENHEKDLHMTDAISKRTNLDNNGTDYAKKIKKNREDELKHLKKLLNEP